MLAGLLARAVGIEVTDINYLPHSGGGESLASVPGSHVAAGINGSAELISFIDAGRLRPLGISSEERVAGLDIPTFKEQGVEVSLEQNKWFDLNLTGSEYEDFLKQEDARVVAVLQSIGLVD